MELVVDGQMAVQDGLPEITGRKRSLGSQAKDREGTKGCLITRRRAKGPTSGGKNQGTEGLRVVNVVARFLGGKA